MAKLVSNLGAIAGSVGNLTFASNKGGQYIRSKGTTHNPSTVRQQQARTALSTNAAAWRLLTDAQRESWAEYALANAYVNKLGESHYHTAQQEYVGINSRLKAAGLAVIAVAPTGGVPASLDTASGAVVGGALTMALTFTTSPLPTGVRLMIKFTGPGSPGKDPNESQARLLGFSAAAATTGVVIPLRSVFATGQATNLYVYTMNASGQISPGLKVRVVAT